MGSEFAGQVLFDSGPHRFVIRSVGRLWLPPLAIDELQDAIEVLARPIELAIVQTGRLVFETDDDLWDQVELIRSRAESALKGTLIEHSGREWEDMTMLRFRPDDRVDRGRRISLAYRVDYIRLAFDAP
ncbi:MAG: hypothetical protein EA376_00140 [Phycisphaeraceae bacterium]|nr:MAG: hypothetical protein EA376_00140 [Phycisphaeraceae bacterium]